MKLENQVCSLEQAKRLKELGVVQDSLFNWCCIMPDPIGEQYYYAVEYRFGIEETLTELIASAFTVAELGVAIGKGTKAAEMLHNDVMVAINSGHSITIVLDPIFLCDSLIRSIENNHITPTSVNQRLSND